MAIIYTNFRPMQSWMGLALLAIVGLAQCTPANDGGTSTQGNKAVGKTVRMYHHRYLVQDEELYGRFQANTECDIALTPMSGQAILEAALRGELQGGDIVVLESLYQAHQLRKAGLIEPYNVGNFGHEVPSRYVDNEGYWAGLTRWTMGYVYNPEKLDYYAMQRYTGMLADEMLGRVVMSHPDSSGFVTFAATMWGAYGAIPTRAYLEKLAGNLAHAPRGNDLEAILEVANGTADIAFVNVSEFLRYRYSGDPEAFRRTESLAVAIPRDARDNNFYDITPVCVLKNPPQRRYALSLIDYLTLRQNQTPYAEAAKEYPVNVYADISSFLLDIEGVAQGAFRPEMAEPKLDSTRQLIREIFAE